MNGNFPAWINGYVHKEIHRLDNWPVLTHTTIDVIKAVRGVLYHCDGKSTHFYAAGREKQIVSANVIAHKHSMA